jgi:cell wall-associated NlpC family hydrolase
MRPVWLAIATVLIAGCASAPPKKLGTPARAIVQPQRTDPPLLPAPPASARARELALHALSHIGIPYRFGGSSPDTGFDCSGLVQYVYSRGAGLALPRSTEAMSEIGAAVEWAQLEPGDLVFFDTLRRPYSHVGIYVGDQRFIHAPTTGGAVELVDMRQRYWHMRFSGARRLGI